MHVYSYTTAVVCIVADQGQDRRKDIGKLNWKITNSLMTYLAVLTQYTSVTDRLTDRQIGK